MRGGLAATVALGAVGASYLAMRTPRGQHADRRLAARLRRPRGRSTDVALGATTDAGSMYAVAGTAATLALRARRRAAVDTLLAGTAGWTAAQLLKRAVDRPRPYDADGAERVVAVPAGSSWPSGHPAVTAAVATALAPRLRRSALLGAVGLTAHVALSRVYVGVHYPSDVVAGAGLGVLAGSAVGALRR